MRINKDLLAGLMYLIFGGATALIAVLRYDIGTPGRMGPGFFPTMVGGLIAVLGALVAVRAAIDAGWQPVPRFHIRPLVFVTLSVGAFALLIEDFGLLVALAALIGVASLGSTESRLQELPVIVLLLSGLAAAIFVYGLGMPLQFWGWL